MRKDLELLWINIEDVVANAWNPNEQSQTDFKDLIASICSEGFILPAVVRNHEDGYELIDGEHRRRALIFLRDHAGDLEDDLRSLYTTNTELRLMIQRGEMPVINLGEIDKDSAMRLGMQINEIGGSNDLEKLKENLKDLQSRSTLSEMAHRLPFTLDRLKEMIDGAKTIPPKETPQKPPETWVDYHFRVPLECKAIIDSELMRIAEVLGYPADIEELTSIQMGLALEKICVLSGDTPTESLL